MGGSTVDFVVGAVAIGVSFIPGVGALSLGALSLSGILQTTGASFLMRGVSKAVSDVDRRQRGILANVASTQTSIPLVYGKAKVGLRVIDTRVDTNSEDNKILARVGALALGGESDSLDGIQGVDRVWFDDKLAVTDVMLGLTSSNVTNRFRKPNNDGWFEYQLVDGSEDQTVPADLDSRFTEYTADHRARGIAYMYFKMEYNKDVFRTGIPRITAEVNGHAVWDPRAPGWSWAENDNPALCILDYLTSKKYGLGANYPERDADGTESEIDEQSFIDAANYCEEQVTLPDSTTQDRFTCNGVLDTSRPIEQNLKELLSSCRGDLVYQNGKFRIVIRQSTTAETFELDEHNIIGDWSVKRAGSKDVPNVLHGTFIDPAKEYQSDTVVWPRPGDTNNFLTNDNSYENQQEIDLVYTNDWWMCEQILMVMLRESRADTTVAVTATEEALKLQIGEVVKVTHETPGWTDKEFWVASMTVKPDNTVRLLLQEYDANAYSLDAQNTLDTPPGTSLPDINTIAAPTNLTLTSDESTALDTQDGQRVPQIKATWTATNDPFLYRYIVRYRIQDTDPGTSGNQSGEWQVAEDPMDADTEALIGPVTDGETYDVQIIAVNTIGVQSDPLEGAVTASTKASSIPVVRAKVVGNTINTDADGIVLDPYVRYDLQVDIEDGSEEGGTLYIYTNPDGVADATPPLDGSDPESPAEYDGKVTKSSTPISITTADTTALDEVLFPMFGRKQVGFLWVSDSGRRDTHLMALGENQSDRKVAGAWLRQFLADEFGLDLTYGGAHRGMTLEEFEAEWLAGFLGERRLTPSEIASSDGLTTLMDGDGKAIKNLLLEDTVTDSGARAISLFLAKPTSGDPDDLDGVDDGVTYRRVIQVNSNGEVTAGSIKVGQLSAISADIGQVNAGTIEAGIIIATDQFTASNAVFEGEITVQAGTGTVTVKLGAISTQGVLELYDGGSISGEVRAIGGGGIYFGGPNKAALIGEGGGTPSTLRFFSLSPGSAVGQQDVTGATVEDALRSLLTALGSTKYNLVTDSTTF